MDTDHNSPHVTHDVMDPARATALCAILGLSADFLDGAILPPFFHQAYFWQVMRPDDLGRDGHARLGQAGRGELGEGLGEGLGEKLVGLIPDLGLPRRMWAGGRLEFHRDLHSGTDAVRETQIENITRKKGRSGPLAFVTLRHEIRQGDQLCLTEWQDLVYRQNADPTAPKPAPVILPDPPQNADRMQFDTTLLFRYSALTMNGHRIHYDETYSRQTEGYDGLVVHGPLLAQLMMLKAQRALGPLAGFQFRAFAPLIHTECALLCRAGAKLWVQSPDGRLYMQASARAKGWPRP